VVLAACFALAWFTLLPAEFSWFARSILWSAPFLANGFFARATGYFDPGAHNNLLLHLWSLGVEEQFYLLWPILLMLAVRYGVTTRVLVAGRRRNSRRRAAPRRRRRPCAPGWHGSTGQRRMVVEPAAQLAGRTRTHCHGRPAAELR
jgi:peptidoglycan/LPS O-acetylase OafA/YrhL